MSPTSSKIANDTSHMVDITYGEPLLQQISYIFDSPIPCSTPELSSKVFVDLRRGLCPKPEDSKLGPSTLDPSPNTVSWAHLLQAEPRRLQLQHRRSWEVGPGPDGHTVARPVAATVPLGLGNVVINSGRFRDGHRCPVVHGRLPIVHGRPCCPWAALALSDIVAKSASSAATSQSGQT